MSDDVMQRRDVLKRLAIFGGMALVPFAATGCKKEAKGLSCSDTAGLSEADIAIRKSLEYADTSSDASKSCDQCQLFKPAGDNQCGGCQTVKGPIHPKGSCKAFAKKA